MLTELTTDTLETEINQHETVLVQYSAGWCGNCRIMKPKFKKMANEHTHAKFFVIDAEKNPNVKVFHAGTSIIDGSLIATGGRVLNVTSIADTLELAREHAYSAIEKISYKGKIYRNDIAWRALSKIT